MFLRLLLWCSVEDTGSGVPGTGYLGSNITSLLMNFAVLETALNLLTWKLKYLSFTGYLSCAKYAPSSQVPPKAGTNITPLYR